MTRTSSLLLIGLLCAAPALRAAPDTPTQAPDPLMQLLRDKGLLTSVEHMRDGATELVLAAMNFLGVAYRPGGNNAEQGFDCSGFTRFIFERSLGLVLPRRSEQQAQHAALQIVRKEELKPGDLVFFNTMRRAFSHVGIYIGEGRFIHSPRAGGEVRIEDMRLAYWVQRFDGARRADALPAAVPAALPAAAAGATEP